MDKVKHVMSMKDAKKVVKWSGKHSCIHCRDAVKKQPASVEVVVKDWHIVGIVVAI